MNRLYLAAVLFLTSCQPDYVDRIEQQRIEALAQEARNRMALEKRLADCVVWEKYPTYPYDEYWLMIRNRDSAVMGKALRYGYIWSALPGSGSMPVPNEFVRLDGAKQALLGTDIKECLTAEKE